MQSVSWYVRRLRAMRPSEVVSRLGGLATGTREWMALKRGCATEFHRRFRPAEVELGDMMRLAPTSEQWCKQAAGSGIEGNKCLQRRAQAAREHCFTGLGLDSAYLGSPIDWNRDHAHGVSTPLVFSHGIDYRDFNRVGDCKLVWEPNRHHQLVVLGRWYALTRDQRFAREVIDQLESWMEASPFLRGMNWRSPLELSIRLINWCWALHLIRHARIATPAFNRRLLDCIADHVGHVASHYSCGSSANNHLVGEAAGVWIATNVFRQLKDTAALRSNSQALLDEQILAQTYPDGGSREQATGYLLFVAQFFLLAGLVGRWAGHDFSRRYWDRLESIFEFLHMFSQIDDRLPHIGDGDDGYVLDLGGQPGDVREWVGAAAIHLGRPDWLGRSKACSETACWLLGAAGVAAHAELKRQQPVEERLLTPRAFPESGYYLLQSGRPGDPNVLRAVMDCGPLGHGSLAAHGHADALSFVLYAFGNEVMVDPGTYDYFTYPQWREYFRSTAAHNTIVIDGRCQAESRGPFLWGRRGETRCLRWEPNPWAQIVTGEHRSYGSPGRQVVHRRGLALEPEARRLTIHDVVQATGHHELAMPLHFSPACRVVQSADHQMLVRVAGGKGVLTVHFDERLTIDVRQGPPLPGPGWVSRQYHQKEPAPALVGRASFVDKIETKTVVEFSTVRGAGAAEESGAERDAILVKD